MAIQIAFVFQSPDRTDYLNQRLAGLIGKGLYSGAELTPTGSGLTATRAPFFALGKDGITLWDTEVGTFAYTTGQDNYHCIYARYNPLGTPSTPVVQELILSTTAYNTHPDKAYLIVVAKVTPAGAVLLSSEIDYSLRDEVGPFGRAQLRGVVDTEGELPTGTPNWNRSGDLYICNDDPTPGGGGLYMWEGGTSSWRLVAARGAATLDGAYDNNGAGGPPGYGRWIEVDAQAVELLQDNTSQRQNDIANAALRIRKTGSTAVGDVGIDVAFAQDKDVGGLLIRSLFTSGTYIQQDEPVNVSGGTITGTRGGANWNQATIHKVHVALVELSGSSQGNDGLFVAVPTGPNTCTVRTLDGSTPTLTTETGLTANFFSIRKAIGARVGKLQEYDWNIYAGEIEFLGNASLGTSVGKVTYYTPGTISWVWQVRATNPGAGSTAVAVLTDGGSLQLYPLAAYADGDTLYARSDNALYSAVNAYHSGAGYAVEAKSVNESAIYAESTNHYGMEVTTYSGSWFYSALRVWGNTATGVYTTVTGTSAALLASSSAAGGKAIHAELQNAGDTTGYGIYSKHAGNGISIFSETLGTGGGIAVKGEVDGADAIGIYGEHLLGSYAGWGVMGWNNNSDANKGAVDGFAWGNGPGVQGGSVFGKGVYGNSSILSLLPGVHGHGFGLGSGIKGTSDFGFGVEGSGFAYDDDVLMSYKTPLEKWLPQEESYWNYGTAGGGATLQPAWCLTSGSGVREIWFVWTDFPHGIIVKGISVRTSQPATVNYSLVAFRRHLTWAWNGTAQAYGYSTESSAYLINTSYTLLGTGTFNAIFGPGSTPAVTALNLYQPARKDPSDTSNILGSELCIYFSADATMNLKEVSLTCELRGATKWIGPLTA